jgi:osmotically-inducible protein OsmY
MSLCFLMQAALSPAGYRRSDMTNSKLRFGFPLAIALAMVSAAAVADGKCGSGKCSGDAKVTTNVQALLDRHPELGAPHSITVQTRAGVVYLYGEVSAGLERETAESLAARTPGVARVVDSIFVSH